MTDIISQILNVSSSIVNGRDCKDVMCSTASEAGELAEEVRIKYGPSYKVAGADGILGEAVDLLINAVDMIYVDNPAITLEDIEAIVQAKLCKWTDKERERRLLG